MPTPRAAPAALDWIEAQLVAADVPTARGDAEIIVGHVLGMTRRDVQRGAVEARELDDEQLATVVDFTARRQAREPIQYLTGVSFFRDIVLEVGPGVFVPRRETEYVAELAVQELRALGAKAPLAIDAGAGAGAIGLSIATEVPTSIVYAIEIEPSAVEWLRRNVAALAPERAHPVLGDMSTALPDLVGEVDVVAGNPPWIPDNRESPTPEVALFEKGARVHGGGADGLDVMRGLSRAALRWLRPGGLFVTEHGVSMGEWVASLLEADGWADIVRHVDPSGRQRVATARRA
jgi:release factor glutamine methyltransferase